jgi:ABC-2 type transport system permease protein
MRDSFYRIADLFIRISAFITKEYFSTLSQPRLLGVLILGPFLILLLFGISYQNTYRTLRTIIVVSENNRIEASVKAFAELPMPGIEVVNILSNTNAALNALESQLVDLVLVIPPDAVQKIEENQQAVFTYYHQEIDPFEVAYVEIVADRLTEQTNRELLLSLVEQSKAEMRLKQSEIHDLLKFGETTKEGHLPDEGVNAERGNILNSADLIWFLLHIVGERVKSSQIDTPDSLLVSTASFDISEEVSNGELQIVDAELTRFVEMDSQVIVEPFRRETRSLSEIDILPVHFYVPAVLALLLQHIAISLAGLSIVSERFAGTMELMRAAPVNALEVLLGKYLGFLIIVGILVSLLTALIHWILGVPFLGSVGLYALVILLVTMVSLGIGFLISNYARSDSQAIQVSMVLMLASIFFSGFFLQLYQLRWPAQIVSWLMPSTYGLQMLQDIMLRGTQPESWLFWVLGGFAMLLFTVNWLRLRKLMVQN